MFRSKLGAVCVALFAVALVGGPADAQKKGDKKGDKVVGDRWEYTAKDKKGNEVESGTFRAHDYKIYKGAKQIGTFARTGKDEVKLDITEGKLKGTIELRRTRENMFRGEWTRPDGDTYRLMVKMLEK